MEVGFTLRDNDLGFYGVRAAARRCSEGTSSNKRFLKRSKGRFCSGAGNGPSTGIAQECESKASVEEGEAPVDPGRA